MVDLMTVALFATAGLGVYLVGVPFVAMAMPAGIRKRVGDAYAGNAARLLDQFTYVRRILSGFDILTLDVDAERKLLEVTLDGSSIPGKESKTYRFANPDDRIKRLFKKPVAMNFEQVPAAIDAELAELGHWTREKQVNEGLNQGGQVDPYVTMPDESGLHIADPIDAFELVPNAVTPENITTTEEETKKRFERYGDAVGVRETLATVIGFLAGAGMVLGMRYLNRVLLDGSGGSGGAPIDVPLGSPGMIVADLAVIGL